MSPACCVNLWDSFFLVVIDTILLKHVLASGNGLERQEKYFSRPFSALKAMKDRFWLAELLCQT